MEKCSKSKEKKKKKNDKNSIKIATDRNLIKTSQIGQFKLNFISSWLFICMSLSIVTIIRHCEKLWFDHFYIYDKSFSVIVKFNSIFCVFVFIHRSVELSVDHLWNPWKLFPSLLLSLSSDWKHLSVNATE